MGEKFKEHWQVAIITAIAFVIITSASKWLYGQVVKVDKAATEQYVDTKIEDEIANHEEKDSIYRKAQDQKINKMSKQIDQLFIWEVESRRK